MVVPVVLDGVPLRALLDTGASTSVVIAPGLARIGLDPARLAGDPSARMSGIGPRGVIARRHRFTELRVGADRWREPLLWTAPVRVVPIVDMLLGADWLAGRLVWISFATAQVFTAPR
jgi:hypothetical protein